MRRCVIDEPERSSGTQGSSPRMGVSPARGSAQAVLTDEPRVLDPGYVYLQPGEVRPVHRAAGRAA